MITPAEIVKKAERKYRDVLRAHLSGEALFPLDFPVGSPPHDLVTRREQIDALRQRSKEVTGQGYTLDWQTVTHRGLGQQTTPRRVLVETLDDYLALVRKRTEYTQFVADAARIRHRLPALEPWMHSHPQQVVEYAGKWDDLLSVCAYFVQQPRPNVYIRELPIPVHTKFIETHSRVLRDLLDALLPADAIAPDERDFNRRFGLKSVPATVRLRLLDEQLDWRLGLRLDDLTLPIAQAVHLLADHVQPKTVLIAENLVNFLTLPAHPESVAVFGGGYAVLALGEIAWLTQCRVLYWGDIDAHGFQILANLRGLLPHVESLMMDQQTFDAHAAYVVQGTAIQAPFFGGLTDAESALAAHVTAQHLRLEQEHIPQGYALAKLREALRMKNAL